MKQNIIAVDFDGTLCENKWPEIGMPNEELIEYLKKRQANGEKLILWTSRNDGEWDYGCACYESALKAFGSLCEDGHSGFSIGLTKAILNRLINNKPLLPIEDTDELSFRQMVDNHYRETYYCHDYLKAGHKKLWWYIEQNDYNLYYCQNHVYTEYKNIGGDSNG